VKLQDLQVSQNNFHRRANDRSRRMQGLVSLFQAGEISARKFRHLSGLLKAEHRIDCREAGEPVGRDFK
jgi:hypothetical protein